jgi:hypothetical protein
MVRDWWSGFTRRNAAKLRALPLVFVAILAAGVAFDRWAATNREQVVAVALLVLAGALAVACVGVVVLWRRESTGVLPRGVPEPPAVRYDSTVRSGCYFLTLRHRQDPQTVNHWKIGKSTDVDNRVKAHRTITGDVLVEEGRIHTLDYDELEDRVKADLRPWRIDEPGVTAVELYEPTPQVEQYIRELLRRAGR